MSDARERSNAEYLAAATAWIRLLLARQAAPEGQAQILNPADERPADADAGDAELRAAEMRLGNAAAADPTPDFEQLVGRLDLLPFERDVLLLAIAMELDTMLPALCAQAQRDPSKAYPTFALAFTIFGDGVWQALSPERPLRYWRLIEIHQAGAQPLTASALRADERVVNAAKGMQHVDDRLAPFLFPLEQPHDHAEPPASTHALIAELVDVVRGSGGGGPPPLLQLLGADAEMKQLVAAHAAAALGANIARLPADLLPQNAADVETLVRLWSRETLLLPIALYVDASGSDDAPNPALKRFLLRLGGLAFLDARDAPVANVRTFEVPKPTAEEQRALWSAAFPDPEAAAALSAQFDLGAPRIRRIASQGGTAQRAWDAAQNHTRARLDALAQRVDCKATWNDIVLPAQDLQLLRRIAGQVRQRTTVYDDWGFRAKMNRGLGISALFVGESGTGKTMAAEVIANELRLNLYRIDLSSVINKYIGETEKNLRRLFDAADDGGAILFFDEAEALFGRRVESKDSHDRNANIEIAYLLQRMETYRGLAILATNKRNELDNAFLRRIRFVVMFPFPAQNERRALWRKALPAGVPQAELDPDRLARLNLSGGSVRNVAVNASFAAADQGTPVTMQLLLEAARAELRKLEKPISEAELTWKEAV